MGHYPSMEKLVEKFCNFSHSQGFCENVRNFISYVNSKHGVNATIVISFVILGCLPHLIHVLINKKPKSKPKKLVRKRSFIIREIHNGYPELDRLMEDDYKHALVSSSTLDGADKLLRAHLEEDFPNLILVQQCAVKLEMGGKEEDGEKILDEALKMAIAEKKSQEAYEIEMLLVEMLIYKGGNSDLKKALECKCLNDESLKDARRPLYKAIIYNMLGKQNEAKKYWDEFVILRDPDLRRRNTDDDDYTHFRMSEQLNRIKNAKEAVEEKKKYFARLLPLVVSIFFTLFSKLRKKSL